MNIFHQSAFNIDLNLEPDWCAWFTGWVDGEGSFGSSAINNTGRGIYGVLKIEVRSDDAPLIYNVENILQCGSISLCHQNPDTKSYSPNRETSIRWQCNDIGACRHILIPLFDKFPLRSKKRRDYEIWRKLIIAISEKHHLGGNRDYVLDLCGQLQDVKRYITPPPENVYRKDSQLDLWYSWLSGLVDGEGCWMYQTRNGGGIKNKYIYPTLQIEVRDDDSSLIYSIADILECGAIRHKKERNTRKPTTVWSCCDIPSCRNVLIPLFDLHPLKSKKQRDYEIWRELVMTVSEKHHLNGDRDYVLGLCQQLKDIKKYAPSL